MSIAKATLQMYDFFVVARYPDIFSRTAVVFSIHLLPLLVATSTTIAVVRSGVCGHLKATSRTAESMPCAVLANFHPHVITLDATTRIRSRFSITLKATLIVLPYAWLEEH